MLSLKSLVGREGWEIERWWSRLHPSALAARWVGKDCRRACIWQDAAGPFCQRRQVVNWWVCCKEKMFVKNALATKWEVKPSEMCTCCVWVWVQVCRLLCIVCAQYCNLTFFIMMGLCASKAAIYHGRPDVKLANLKNSPSCCTS